MFCHLHVHSEYSMLESSVKIDNLLDAACSYGMKSVALTDKYVMGGCMDFYKKALFRGIKPIIGCEICVKKENKKTLYHLILLAKDITGYRNLCRIVSDSHIRSGKGQVPFIEKYRLSDMSKGLIALSGCIKGEIPSLVQADIKKAKAAADTYLDIFGDDFFLEIQRYPVSSLSRSNTGVSEMVLNLAERKGIHVVATNDVHYIYKKDYSTYKALARIRSMSAKKDPTSRVLQTRENSFKTTKEMEKLFPDIPEAIYNTGVIAGRCVLEIPIGTRRIPKFKTPGTGKDHGSYLEKICLKGLRKRYGKDIPEDVSLRLEKELNIIDKTGFTDYFLIVADMAKFAYENKIPLCGKGSAAGSLVSYALRISNIDPVKNDLYFERFLNEGRKSLPDIDIDISNKDRDKVIGYFASRHGKYKISRVSTFSTTKPRAAIRESARILGMAKEDVDYLIRSVPGYNRFFSHKDMESSIGESGIGDIAGSQYDKVLRISKMISGYVRHISMHPSAIIVSDMDFYNIIPLTLSDTGEIMSQYDKESIESLGIMKLDLINSLSLCLISDVSEILRTQRDIRLKMDDISYDDTSVYDMISSGQTLGVFQIESFGIRTLARKVKPSKLNDITLLISLYRPGPQQSGMVKNFVERKFLREKTTFIHEDLRPILDETFGIILYQEQVMKISLKIAGYSLSEADTLRKAMTRLSKQSMEEQRSRFICGARKNGYKKDIAEKIFTLISKFASYGFVKAHAAAYAELSYKTCFLKRYYPAEFFAVILSNGSGYYPKMQYVEEARRYGVKIKPPDANKSDGFKFTTEDDGFSIRVPLSSIKSLGPAISKAVARERKRKGPFDSLDDFCFRLKGSGITSDAVKNMIKVGSFDFTGLKRKHLLFYFEQLLNCKRPQSYGLLNVYEDRQLDDFCHKERIEIEMDILGFCIGEHPLGYFKKDLLPYDIVSSSEFYSMTGGYRVFTAGFVLSKRIEKTRSGKKMLFCTMEDQDGMYEAVCFPDLYKKMIKAVRMGASLLIEGRLGFKDNSVSLIVKDVKSLKVIERSGKQKETARLRDMILSSVDNVGLWKAQEK